MRTYYIKGKKISEGAGNIIPIDKIESWFILDNIATIEFYPKAWVDGCDTVKYEYPTEDEAVDDMNKMWEWFLK